MWFPGPDRSRLLCFDANHWGGRVASMLRRPTGTKDEAAQPRPPEAIKAGIVAMVKATLTPG